MFITTFSMTLPKTKRLVKMSLTQMKRVKMWMIMKVLFSVIRLNVKGEDKLSIASLIIKLMLHTIQYKCKQCEHQSTLKANVKKHIQ